MKPIESKEELQTWSEYAEFMKLQLKTLEGAGAPFLVSKEKLAFDDEGKPWKGHAVLAGPKGLMSARKLQKEGVLFREGTCEKSGKELRVDGLEAKLAKEAARTLKRLRLGYKIAGVEEDGDESEPGSAQPAAEASAAPASGAAGAAGAAAAPGAAPGAAAAATDLAARAAKIAKAVEIWNKTEEAATKELRKLQKALLGLGDPRSKPIIQGLESILARIDAVDDEALAASAAAQSGDANAFGLARTDLVRKLEGIRSYVEQDELIRQADTNPLLEVRIRETFTKSLTQLLKAI